MQRDKHDQEVIFESPDAFLEATSPSGARLLAAMTIDEDDSNSSISKDPVDPLAAYQAFHQIRPFQSQEVFSLAAGNERKMESPLQRFQRLRSELAELSTDLDRMVAPDQASIWSALQAETGRLVAQADRLEGHAGWRAGEGMVQHKLGELLAEHPAGGAAEAASAHMSPFMPQLERRVHRLECLLGQQANTSSGAQLLEGQASPFPVLDTLHRLERKLGLLDAAAIEALRAKANLLKWELEAMAAGPTAAAARKKEGTGTGAALPAAPSSASSGVLDAARRIEQLAAQVSKVQAAVEDLPALVMRLRTLDSVHWNAASASSRLQQLEASVQAALGSAQENGELLREMRQGLQDNLSNMQDNLRAVEGKLAERKG